MTSSPSSWGGVVKTSAGLSWTVSAERESRTMEEKGHVRCRRHHVERKDENAPSSSARPCMEGRETSVTSSSMIL